MREGARTASFDDSRVALYTAVLDDDGLLPGDLARSCQGLVVAGSGRATSRQPSPRSWAIWRSAFPRCSARVPAVGPVLRHTYGAVGSETDLMRRGLLNAGLLDPYKARVLLRLLLARGAEREAIEAAFTTYG